VRLTGWLGAKGTLQTFDLPTNVGPERKQQRTALQHSPHISGIDSTSTWPPLRPDSGAFLARGSCSPCFLDEHYFDLGKRAYLSYLLNTGNCNPCTLGLGGLGAESVRKLVRKPEPMTPHKVGTNPHSFLTFATSTAPSSSQHGWNDAADDRSALYKEEGRARNPCNERSSCFSRCVHALSPLRLLLYASFKLRVG